MVKTLTDIFKIGKLKEKKLDLVSVVNNAENRYENDFNKIYSDAQTDREKYENLLNRYSDGDILKQEKKNYNFSKSMKRGIATLAAIVGLGFMGCSSPVSSTEEENHAPTITSSSIDEIEEGKSYSYLVKANDKDGDNLNYSISGPEWLSINQDGFISGTAPNVDEDENCSVTVKVSDSQETAKQNYTLKVKNIPEEPTKDYVDISGILQDNETDTGREGTIQIYDTKTDGTYSDLLGETTSDSEGKFSLKLDKLVDANDKIYVRSVMNNFENPTSYIRTKELPAKDLNLTKTSGTSVQDLYENGLIAVVPFDNPDDSYDNELDIVNRKEDFKEHMRRVNFNAGISQLGFGDTLKKWNYGELPSQAGRPIFQGIEIDPDNWTDGTPQNIIDRFKDSEYPNVSNIQMTIGRNHINENGWIRIMYEHPDLGRSPGAVIYDEGKGLENPIGDGYISYVEIYLNTTDADVVDHEGIHGLGQVGHADNETEGGELFSSLMVYTGSTAPAKSADIKASYIIDEPTYSGMEIIEDILG